MATNGMLYLGICGPRWSGQPVTVGNNEYREAYGYCAHAIGNYYTQSIYVICSYTCICIMYVYVCALCVL